MSLSIYGKLPKGERLKRILRSPNYKNGSFQNMSPTNAMAENASFYKLLRAYMKKPANVKPSQTLPHVKTDLHTLAKKNIKLIWFGHSSYLLNIQGVTVLVDPVFSGNAAPLSFMVRSFAGTDAYTPNDMPPIDILLLTHDHYDHLDHKTLLKLKHKVKKIYCSLGLGSHLEHWGFQKRLIHELDWWESATEGEITLTAAPGRHFSGRGIKRGQTLWSSFMLRTKEHHLFLGGDSGYDTHFKEIGEKFGPFDIAILESGQYNLLWPHIHMLPEQTVQACVDLRAEVLLPVHWAKFTLALHPWDEPIERVLMKAKELKLKVCTPLIGEPYTVGETCLTKRWWNLNEK